MIVNDDQMKPRGKTPPTNEYKRKSKQNDFIFILILAVLIFVGYLFLHKKHELFSDPETGQTWVQKTGDPFKNDYGVEILDTKNNHVQYKYIKIDKIDSERIFYFKQRFKPLIE